MLGLFCLVISVQREDGGNGSRRGGWWETEQDFF